MEQVKYTTKTITVTTHYFYCDDCGKFLGHYTEEADGYYNPIGNFAINFPSPRGLYKLRKCLCDDCQDKFMDKLDRVMKELGFQHE